MPGLIENFFSSKGFTFVAAALAFLAAAILISISFRFAFGRRVRLPRNGRTRQPRLGIVDAFDLDRKRQLVIVRRDNIEHLLMIGGPNDLVIEAEIIRSESRDPRGLRESRHRDKEIRERELRRELPPQMAGGDWPSPVAAASPDPSHRKMPLPSSAEAEPQATLAQTLEESMRIPAPAIPSPPTSPLAFSLPPKRNPPLVVRPGQRPGAQREPLQSPNEPHKREPGTNNPGSPRRAPVTMPFLRSSMQRRAQGAAAHPPQSNESETRPDDPNVMGPHLSCGEPAQSSEDDSSALGQAELSLDQVPSIGGPITEDSLSPARDAVETLEEEMARLLGRGTD
jgi:flagellar protein FliO/FliZ